MVGSGYENSTNGYNDQIQGFSAKLFWTTDISRFLATLQGNLCSGREKTSVSNLTPNNVSDSKFKFSWKVIILFKMGTSSGSGKKT